MAYATDDRRKPRRRAAEERRSYGALNAVGGFSRYGRYMYVQPEPRAQGAVDPVYRGPCPPNPNGTDLENVYASFYSDGEVSVNEYSPTVSTQAGVEFRRVELNGANIVSEEGIIKEKTRILIMDPGVYVVMYNINVPREQEIDTTFALLYDREVIEGSGAALQKDDTGMSLNASGHALITVDGNGAELILGSTGYFDLLPASYTSNITLSIFSIA